MGATSATGVSGPGSAEAYSKGPQNNRTIYQSINGPHMISAGEIINVGNCWQIYVDVRGLGLTENPDYYSVFITQSDWTNYDYRPNRPAHVEKLDIMDNNWDEVDGAWVGPMGAFVLHVGDSSSVAGGDYSRKFAYVIVRNGGALSYGCY
jgi:hypothetical protein